MGDGDVFAKLSRILETHTIQSDEKEESMDEMLQKLQLEAKNKAAVYDADYNISTSKKKK